MKIKIPVSVGELLDKITILQIKSKHNEICALIEPIISTKNIDVSKSHKYS
jgi:hypothetical protein